MVRKRRSPMVQERSPGRLADVKRSMALQLGLLFFDMPDVREAGPAAKHAGEFGQSVARTGGGDFDAAVREIERVPAQVERCSCVLGKVTICVTLDAALDDPPPGAFGRAGHTKQL